MARRAFEEVDVTPSKNLNDEWYQLSWLKDEFGEPVSPNPIRVIGLAQKMAHDMDPFRGAAHMTSSFYSQVKHLLKMKQVPTAIAFFLESRKWSTLALERRQSIKDKELLQPMDLEVIGATDFMLAKLPVIGILFKRKALAFLKAAESELTEWQGFVNRKRVDPISIGIVFSKIYSLTGDNAYKGFVRLVGLTRHMDQGQLLRIANHLGFKSLEELYTFCRM